MQNSKQYDLEDRTLSFARKVRDFTINLTKSPSNNEYIKQLVRSSGSIGANYIEANESLGKKDFVMHIKICKKEAKETRYSLQLINCPEQIETTKIQLFQESTELMKIFGAILEKTKQYLVIRI